MLREKKKQLPGKNRIPLMLVIGSAVTALTLSFAFAKPVARLLTWAPNPAKLSAKDCAKYIASKEFSELPQDEKKKFYVAVMDTKKPSAEIAGLAQNERRKFFENTRSLQSALIAQRAKEYFAIPPGDARNQWMDDYLKKQREEREKMRAARDAAAKNANGSTGGASNRGNRSQANASSAPGAAPPGNNSQFGRGGGGNMARMKERIETRDPVEHAVTVQFFREMRDRAVATGTAPTGGGSGRGR